MHKILWDFDIQTDHLILARWLDLVIVNKNQRNCWIVGFAIPADHRVKLKDGKKRDKYLDLAREQKKLWNMKMTVIPIVIGMLSTVTKGLVQGLKELEIRTQWRPSKWQNCWDWPEYWEDSWRLEETCCHSNSSERSSADASVKNSQRNKIIIAVKTKHCFK